MIARRIHFYLLAFLGVTAIGGGGILIISPSGKLLGGLPLSILVKSPFKDFFYPGIILFLILGVLPCLVIYSLIQKPESKFAESLNFFQRYVLGLVVQYLYSFCPDNLDTSRNHFYSRRWMAANFLYAVCHPHNLCCIVATGADFL